MNVGRLNTAVIRAALIAQRLNMLDFMWIGLVGALKATEKTWAIG